MTSASPRSLCERYNDECYETLRADATRTEAFCAAIAAQAKGKVCLDIGTGSLALLAIAAAEAGARRVYALEANASAAELARRSVVAAGYEDVITVLQGFSMDIGLAEGQPRVELLLHEIIGEIAGAEGVVASLADARARYCGESSAAEPVSSVPARARTLLAPAEWPSAEYFDALPIPLLAMPGTKVLLMPALPHELRLAPEQVFEDLRFDAPSESAALQSRSLEFLVQRDGVLRGLCCWIEIFVADADAQLPEISSADNAGSSWSNVFLVLPQPTAVARGARLVVRTRAELGGVQPTYRFDCLLVRSGGAPRATSEAGAPGLEPELDSKLELLATLRYPEVEQDATTPEKGSMPPPPPSEVDCMVEMWDMGPRHRALEKVAVD